MGNSVAGMFSRAMFAQELQKDYGSSIRTMALLGFNSTVIIYNLDLLEKYPKKTLREVQGSISDAIIGCDRFAEKRYNFKGLLANEELEKRDVDKFSHLRDCEAYRKNQRVNSLRGVEKRGYRSWGIDRNYLVKLLTLPVSVSARGYNTQFLANKINEVIYGGDEVRTPKSVSVEIGKMNKKGTLEGMLDSQIKYGYIPAVLDEDERGAA